MNLPPKGPCVPGGCLWAAGEPCRAPREFCLNPCCGGAWVLDAAADLQSLGRIIRVDVPLRQICPGKRVALAVLLSEIDDCGRERPCGRKIITVPALPGTQCRDVLVRGLQFVLPEDPCSCCCGKLDLCRSRKLAIRTIANYLDADFDCCDPESVSEL